MKMILTFALLLSMQFSYGQKLEIFKRSQVLEHNGGNGGDELEIELRKISIQISSFLKTAKGRDIFRMINVDEVSNIGKRVTFSVVTEEITDRYSAVRACVNEPEKLKITCNKKRINNLLDKNNIETLVTLLLHEVLGILEIELGYREQVSLYPISSKIMPHVKDVLKIRLLEDDFKVLPYGENEKSSTCLQAMKQIGADFSGDNRLWWTMSCKRAQQQKFDLNMGSCVKTMGRVGATGNEIYATVWLDACLQVSPDLTRLEKYSSCVTELVTSAEALKDIPWVDFCLQESLL